MARMLTLQVERLTADGNWQGDGKDITVRVSSMADLRATLGVSSTSVVFKFMLVDLQLMVFFYPRRADNRTFRPPVTQKHKNILNFKKG
jgi:hypothetical protein